MLPQMAWQILDPAPQLRERPHPRPVERQAGRLSVAPERLVRIGELEVVHRLRQPVDLGGVQRQRLTDVARGATTAIRDHIGGHRRPQAAIFLVHVLNDALAAVAARQIEVDVGPLAALLGEEALEQ